MRYAVKGASLTNLIADLLVTVIDLNANTSGTSGSSSTVISGSGVGSISEPGIVVVGAVVSGSGVGSSSEPAIVVLGAVVTGTGLGSGSDSEVSNGDVVVGAVDSEGFESEDAGSEDSEELLLDDLIIE